MRSLDAPQFHPHCNQQSKEWAQAPTLSRHNVESHPSHCSQATALTIQTNSMELSPIWEANGNWDIQEILSILWNWKDHYRVHRKPPLIPILSQMNPVHTFPASSFNIHCNITKLSSEHQEMPEGGATWILMTDWLLPTCSVLGRTTALYMNIVCEHNTHTSAPDDGEWDSLRNTSLPTGCLLDSSCPTSNLYALFFSSTHSTCPVHHILLGLFLFLRSFQRIRSSMRPCVTFCMARSC
jgi:hypothetical protein